MSSVLECPVGCAVLLDQVVGLAGGIALEAADDLHLRLAFGGAAFGVFLGVLVVVEAADDGQVEGGVGLAVAAAVEPVALDLAGGGGQWCGRRAWRSVPRW
jgi:hypothetical protein